MDLLPFDVISPCHRFLAHVNTFETPSTIYFMNFKKSFLAALALAPLLSSGQVSFSFGDNKTFRQYDDRLFEFLGGSLTLSIRDGSFVLSPCEGIDASGGTIPSGAFTRLIQPNLSCPLGTTAFVGSGDVDGDGFSDVDLYISVSSVTRAVQVEPFHPEQISLIAAPPSSLSRPIGGVDWVDSALVLWYDQINRPINSYEITRYDSQRVYGASEAELERQYDEIVPGVWIYQVPRLNEAINPSSPEVPVNPFPFSIGHRQMIEAWPGRGKAPGPNEFVLTNDGLWVDGALEVDPNLFFKFEWRGFNGVTTITNADTTFFSMERTNATDEGPAGQVVFPPYNFAVPDAQRFTELISTPSSGYELGPNFAQVGDEWTGVLDFNRNLGQRTIDNSSRQFRWNVRFVETYPGYARDAFPPTDDDTLLAEGYDYDDDGFTNLEEFALQTDPANPASVPSITPFLDDLTGQCVLSIPKRGLVGSLLSYKVQYTSDLDTWTTILPGDSQWMVIQDDAAVYEVRSRQSPPASCLLRILITQD